MADLQQIEKMIANHINAVIEHERLFNLHDWGLALDADVAAALAPIDDALVTLCATRPGDASAGSRRAEYLNANVPQAIYCDRTRAEAIIAALVGGAV